MAGVYFIKSGKNKYKIGRSFNCQKRIKQLQKETPVKLILKHVVWVSENCELSLSTVENMIHRELAHLRFNGEWFKLTDSDADKYHKKYQQIVKENTLRLVDIWHVGIFMFSVLFIFIIMISLCMKK